MATTAPSVFDYTDYRRFLRDVYEARKAANAAFSYSYIARKAGFKSKSYVATVIAGRRNMSPEALFKLNKVLKLGAKAFSYLSELVAFNQALEPDRRAYHLGRLLEYNPRSKARALMRSQYAFYSQWYHSAVRELAATVDFGDDYDRLGKLLDPPITARQARASVSLLERLGLIRRSGRRWKLVDRTITTGDQVRSTAVRSFHRQNLQLAAESIDRHASDERDISCVVLNLTEDGFRRALDEVRLFRKKLLGLCDTQGKADRIYHLSMQLFPTSNHLRQGKHS